MGHPEGGERRSGTDRRNPLSRGMKAGEATLDFSPFQVFKEAELFGRIEIRDPYFALHQVRRLGESTLQAKIRVEQPLPGEVPPISAGEAARHLAILGACSASLLNPASGKHYYLAYHAEMERVGLRSISPTAWLTVTSSAKILPGRIAISWGLLQTMDGEDVYRLETRYQVVPENVFSRKFLKHRQDLRGKDRPMESEEKGRAMRRNPYKRELPMLQKELSRERIQMEFGPLTPEHCMGHFPRFPAMPTALLMYGLTRTAGLLMAHRSGSKDPYFIKRGSVRSRRLVFPGELIQLQAKHVKSGGREQIFFCEAVAGASAIGDMWLTLEAP